MNNKLKKVLILLFVVSTLLLMIGSVCASDVELNDNLEASLDLDDGLSVYDNSISNPDNKVSNQLTISNIDEETVDDSQIVDADLNNINSNDVVSNTEDATTNAKGSDNNIKAENDADEVEEPEFELTVTPLNDSAKVGDIVSFEVIGRNVGGSFSGIIPIYMQYDENELHYVGFTPGVNYDAPDWYHPADYILGPVDVDHAVWDQKLFGYNCSQIPFGNGFYFNFTVNFEAREYGTPGNYIFIDTANQASAITTTKVIDTIPHIELENNALNPYSNIGDYISFDIIVRNVGTPIATDYIPINVLYSESELAYVGFTRGAGSERVLDPEDVSTWCSQKLFKYDCDGLFDTLDEIKFTLHFRVNNPQIINPGIYVAVDAANNPALSNTTYLDSIFTIEDKSLNTELRPGASGNVNYGGIASFEIFARNTGSNFLQHVPIDIYFDPSELDYVNITAGVNPDAPWFDIKDMFSATLVEAGHLVVTYNNEPFGMLRSNDCLNFTVNFKTLKVGTVGTTAVINWTQFENHQVSSSSTTLVGYDADFKLEYLPSAVIVNVNDTVSFDVVVTNLGGNYYGWLGIDVLYNPEELEFINFTPNFNSENYNTHDENGNPTPNPIDRGNGHLYFGYGVPGVLENGHVFNFTINFKPLKAGVDGKKFMSDASIDWWQSEHHYVNSSAYVFATDADFVLDIIPSTYDLLKVGDEVSFDVVAHNREGTYFGSYIGFDLYYDPSELNFIDFTENDIPDGTFKLESGAYSSSQNGVLGLTILSAEEGHLHFGFRPSPSLLSALEENSGEENTNCSFNFTLKYSILKEGLLENNAELSWANSDNQKAYSSAAVSAGEYNIILSKKPVKEQVSLYDEVEFVVYLKNIGADIYNSSGRIKLDDWFPGGELVYLNYTINGNSTPVNVVKDSNPNYPYHIMIYQSLTNNYWRTGDYLNVTLRFLVNKTGIHCNHIFFGNNSTFGSVIVGEPDLNLTKTVEDHYAELGDEVTFYIFLENKNNSIPYYNHPDGTTDVVIHDVYSDGLEFVSASLGDHNQEGTFKVEEGDNNNLTFTFTPNESRWYNGSYINITVKFKTTKEGKFVNTANFYWKWKDWDDEKEFNLTDDDYVIVGKPEFTIEKISNYETARVGEMVSFTIIYTNTGYRPLTGVYITDNEYTDGIEYSDYSDKSIWTFDGKDTWYYNEVLEPGDSAVLELTFKATSIGQKNNTAVGGHNITDETKNDSDTVLIISNKIGSSDASAEDDEEDVDIPDEDDVDEPDDDSETDVPEPKPSAAKVVSLPKAGNPLFVLLLALLTLCFVPLRGKK